MKTVVVDVAVLPEELPQFCDELAGRMLHVEVLREFGPAEGNPEVSITGPATAVDEWLRREGYEG